MDDDTLPPEAPWTLVLVPLTDDVPAAQRIRRLLKTAASLRLRCVLVRDADAVELWEAGDWWEGPPLRVSSTG